MKPMEARRSALYAHMAAVAAAAARELGLDPSTAEHIGAAVTDAIAEDVGGEVLSFPKDAAYRLSIREREILEAHRNGATLSKLSHDYKMTERGLRKLIARAIVRDRHLNQLALFEET